MHWSQRAALTSIATAITALASPGAAAIVIRYAGSVTDGWQAVPQPNQAIHYWNAAAQLWLVPGQQTFLVLSPSNNWTLSSAISVQQTRVQALQVLGAALTSDDTMAASLKVSGGGSITGSTLTVTGTADVSGHVDAHNVNFGSLAMTSGAIVAGALTVGGSATVSGQLDSSYMSFASLALTGGSLVGNNGFVTEVATIGQSRIALRSLTAKQLDISSSTLADASLYATDSLQIKDSQLTHADMPRGAVFSSNRVTLTGSSGIAGELRANESLVMQDSTLAVGTFRYGGKVLAATRGKLEAASATFEQRLHLSLQSFDLIARGASLELHAGEDGTSPLGLNSGSSLVTGSTALWGDYADPTKSTVFAHAGGLHSTGLLTVPTRTAYELRNNSGDARLETSSIDIAGRFDMYGGTLTAGNLLRLDTEGRYVQNGGSAKWGYANLLGQAVLGGTASVEAQSVSVLGSLTSAERATLQAGSVWVREGGIALINGALDDAKFPTVQAANLEVHGSFEQLAGHVALETLTTNPVIGYATSGRYGLRGGTLVSDAAWISGLYSQTGGHADLKRLYLNGRMELSGGTIDIGEASLWSYAAGISPVLRHVAGTASIGSLGIAGGLLELASLSGSLTIGSLWLGANAFVASQIEHLDGTLHLLDRLDIGPGGEYALSGGFLDGSRSREPMDLRDGGRFVQTGGRVDMIGVSPDSGGLVEFKGGSATFREWAAVIGEMRLDGSAIVEVKGDRFGLYVGDAYVEGETDGPPSTTIGLLSLSSSFTGLLKSSHAQVGDYGPGEVIHEGGQHEVQGLLVLGNHRAPTFARYVLGPTASLVARDVQLLNPFATSAAEQELVRFEQSMGRGRLAFGTFSNLGGTHIVRGSSQAMDWTIEAGSDGGKSVYQSIGGRLDVDANLRLLGAAEMRIASGEVLRGSAQINGNVLIGDTAQLTIARGASFMMLGDMSLDPKGPLPAQGHSLLVDNGLLDIQGRREAQGPTLLAGGASRGAFGTASIMASGPEAKILIRSNAARQLQIGQENDGVVTVADRAVLEVRSFREGNAAATTPADWRPVVIGKAGAGVGLLRLTGKGQMIIEGRGNQLSALNGQADLRGGVLDLISVGAAQRDASGVATVLAAAQGTVQLQGSQSGGSAQIRLQFGANYAPSLGEFIPLISAAAGGFYAGDAWLTPYQQTKLNGVDGYKFRIGTSGPSFEIASPTSGLYPALERIVRDGTEVWGVRYINQAVNLDFATRMQATAVENGPGGWGLFDCLETSSCNNALPLAALSPASRDSLITNFGKIMWGTGLPGKAGIDTLGNSVLLPFFVSDAADGASNLVRALPNLLTVKFSAPKQLGEAVGGIARLDLMNRNKGGQALVLASDDACAASQFACAATLAHEIGHSLGLQHLDTAPGIYDLMDPYVADGGLLPVFTGVPRHIKTLQGNKDVVGEDTQNSMLHLLRYTFGWSPAELAVYSENSDWGSLDCRDACPGSFRAFIGGLVYSKQAMLHDVTLLVGGGDGAKYAVASFGELSLSELEQLSFSGHKGESFDLWAKSSPAGDFDIFMEGSGSSQVFGGENASVRLMLRDTAGATVLAELTLTQAASPVPEFSSWIAWLLGLGWLFLVPRCLLKVPALRGYSSYAGRSLGIFSAGPAGLCEAAGVSSATRAIPAPGIYFGQTRRCDLTLSEGQKVRSFPSPRSNRTPPAPPEHA